ncbi:MAG: AMP-binding protein, partial [Bacteroides sp.]|nr:AMP-binding protein [Bacteroides sp.]
HKYDNIEAAGLNISTFFELTDADRPLMVLPLHYTMGLSMIFSHFQVGATVLITDRNMTDPIFWKFMKEEKATSFTGVPYSYEILDKMRFMRMKLPDLTLLTQGGGKMPKELNLKFAEYCRDNGKKWIATYGQSEGTARMAWLPPEYAISKMGSIGIAVPNGQLSLRNPDGTFITTPSGSGEMCYAGRNVTMGYARCREDLMLGDERNGFLPTGDLAYRDEDGFYYIQGRMGRFLKIFGNRIGLDECEQIVKGVVTCECACTGNDERLIVYLTDIYETDAAKNSLVEAVHLPANVIEIRIIDSLPKNEAGKILYSNLNNE